MNFLVPLCSSLSLIIGLMLFFINPGVKYSDKNSNEKSYCGACKFLYPLNNPKMEHCYDCGVCICKYDHHCGVVGKCVGKYNTTLFFLFVVSNSAFIFCFYLMLFHLITSIGK